MEVAIVAAAVPGQHDVEQARLDCADPFLVALTVG
jgi:hypothetical protein